MDRRHPVRQVLDTRLWAYRLDDYADRGTSR
jgi:hypothetical protein